MGAASMCQCQNIFYCAHSTEVLSTRFPISRWPASKSTNTPIPLYPLPAWYLRFKTSGFGSSNSSRRLKQPPSILSRLPSACPHAGTARC